jgi:oxygen-independent coproporphyrinogen-3 oxidase
MPGRSPIGDPAPADGSLPADVVDGARHRALGVYAHVPFCRVRCGYCDFTTYTSVELGPDAGATRQGYVDAVLAEADLATAVLDRAGLPPRPAATVFVGGGTPTELSPGDLVRLVHGIRERFGLMPGAEITVEANPDSVTPAMLVALAAAGVTRLSVGMQSAVPHVLTTLDRTHDPARVPEVVRWARDAGLTVSLDLIYGTPGESPTDWRSSLTAALDMQPDHVSAYSLTVEPGTRLAARVRRGEVGEPDEDDQADKYELADDLLTAAGYAWYEISSWAREPGFACRHNLGYWRGDDWWGLGPGAHSHVGGVRWWNVRHPRAWVRAVRAGLSPAEAREVLSPAARRFERVMLGSRLAEGLPLTALGEGGGSAVRDLVSHGLADATAARGGRVIPTRRGRLLADVVTRRLVGTG